MSVDSDISYYFDVSMISCVGAHIFVIRDTMEADMSSRHTINKATSNNKA